MNHSDMKKVRDAFEEYNERELSDGSVLFFDDVLDILDRELAAPEQEPVAYWFQPPDKRVAPSFDTARHGGKWKPLFTAPPSREWVELEDDDVIEIADRCTDVFGLADLISEALRAKNEEKPLDESAQCKECGSFACGGECVRRYEHG